jgi:hypothetical protein
MWISFVLKMQHSGNAAATEPEIIMDARFLCQPKRIFRLTRVQPCG